MHKSSGVVQELKTVERFVEELQLYSIQWKQLMLFLW